MDCVLVETLIIHGIVAVWIVHIDLALIDELPNISIANEIAPSFSGVESLWNCSRVLTLRVKRIRVVPG